MPQIRRSLSKIRSAFEGSSRESQLLAALTLPFVTVAVISLSRVLKDVFLSVIPDGVASLAAVGFLVGVGLMTAAFAALFFWVRTGGFRVFA